MFTCAFDLADDVPLGAYRLACSDPEAGSDVGQPLSASCRDGAVTVTCAGDCDGNGDVSVHEVVRGFSIMAGTTPMAACGTLDGDGDTAVSVAELVRGYRSLLNGCGGD